MLTIITLNHSLLRSILGIALGLLFIIWPETAVDYLVRLCGAFFILAGIYSLVIWFWREKGVKGFVPALLWIAMGGSIALGVWLVVMPGFFIRIFGFVWGIILVIAGVQQLISLLKARERRVIPVVYYVFPALILLGGGVILLKPIEAIAGTFVVLGVVSLFYGLNELIGWYKFRPQKAEVVPEDAEIEE
ncbi:MAG: DUF308 domain-containing protein [Clostridiales bacterium]|jgi:uncharacterized membrane protein HdeD (DUF308 family)|nr:DUF308 domain-containing protein [Clostridiales bacterium]